MFSFAFDEYKVRSQHDCDSYGNRLKTTVSSGALKILKEYQYDSSAASLRELLTGETNAKGKMVTYSSELFSDVSTVKDAKQVLQVTSQANDYRDAVSKVTTQTLGSPSIERSVQYGYSGGFMSSVDVAGSNGYACGCSLTHDRFGNVGSLSVNGSLLFNKTVSCPDSSVKTQYANESAFTYGYFDKYGRNTLISGSSESNTITYRDRPAPYTDASSSAKVRMMHDPYGSKHEFFYDSFDKNLNKYECTNLTGNRKLTVQAINTYTYDEDTGYILDEGGGSGKTGVSTSVSVKYDAEKYINPRVKEIYTTNKIEYEYDGLGRVRFKRVYATGLAIKLHFTYYYTYADGAVADYTTVLPKCVYIYEWHPAGQFTEEEYTYDDNCNVVTVERPGKNRSYQYDGMGRLTQESGIGFTYDAGGNLTAKGSTNYAYDAVHKDRLTSTTKDKGFKAALTKLEKQEEQ